MAGLFCGVEFCWKGEGYPCGWFDTEGNGVWVGYEDGIIFLKLVQFLQQT